MNKWVSYKNSFKQNQTTTLATIFGDMTKTKTILMTKELLNYAVINKKQNKYCEEPSKD